MKKLTALIALLALLLAGCYFPGEPPTSGASSGETLLIHCIDVGQADCILVEYGDFSMLIDGGNREDGSLVVSYIEQQGISELDAVVCTHAHEDHVGGLPAVLAVYPTAAVYAPTNTYSSKIFDKFLYYTNQQGLSVTIPTPGDHIAPEGLDIQFLGPVQSYADPNNTSLVLRLEYGDTSFLFTGDMETQAENDMLDYWGSDFDWHTDVLKVGHHGSNTSTGYRFLNAVMPTYGVISVGEGNSYGHPHEEPLSRLTQAGVTLFRTDELGHVIFASDGQTITVTWGNQSGTPTNVDATQAAVTYIGNKNSRKFHTPDCSSLPKEENRVYFDSYEEAVGEGYTPCSGCLG